MDNRQERPHQDYIPTSTGGLYNFLVWALLIIHDGQSRTLSNKRASTRIISQSTHTFSLYGQNQKIKSLLPGIEWHKIYSMDKKDKKPRGKIITNTQKCYALVLVKELIDVDSKDGKRYFLYAMNTLNIKAEDFDMCQSRLKRFNISGLSWFCNQLKDLPASEKENFRVLFRDAFIDGGRFDDSQTAKVFEQILDECELLNDVPVEPITIQDKDLYRCVMDEDLYRCIAAGFNIVEDYIADVIEPQLYISRNESHALPKNLVVQRCLGILCQYITDIQRIKYPDFEVLKVDRLNNYIDSIPGFNYYLADPHICGRKLYESGKVQQALDKLSADIHSLMPNYDSHFIEQGHTFRLLRNMIND